MGLASFVRGLNVSVLVRFGGRALAGAVAVAALTACSGGQSSDPSPSTSGSASLSATPSVSSSVELNKEFPLGSVTRPEPEVVETKSGDGTAFGLVSVVRISPDRVVLSGVLTVESPVRIGDDAEAGYVRLVRGGDFSRVVLTMPGDASTEYLPVRDADGACLCSSLRPGMDAWELPVSVVMSAPKDAAAVDVRTERFGTFSNVPVRAPEPTPGLASPWGPTGALVVESASRQDGMITARVRLQWWANPPSIHGDDVRFVVNTFNPPVLENGPVCLRSVFALSGELAGLTTEAGCVRRGMPAAGNQVVVDVPMGDPGGDTLTFLVSGGFPVFGVPITGEASKGTADVAEFAYRTTQAAATVESGETVKIDLSTEVLFALDSAELTPAAAESIAVAADALKAQPGRSVTVAGHTDSQGDTAYNQDLSQRRADAVKAALASALGAGWTITATGYGESQPAAQETGTPEAIQEAQQRNRRVEVTVGS